MLGIGFGSELVERWVSSPKNGSKSGSYPQADLVPTRAGVRRILGTVSLGQVGRNSSFSRERSGKRE